MADQGRRIIHFYDIAQHHLLCGLDDPSAHWTSRRHVTCPDCAALLEERQRDRARPGATAAHGHDTVSHA